MQPVIVLATGPRSSTGASRSDRPPQLVAEPHAIAVDVAGAAEGVGHFEELLDGELGADGGAADDQPHVVQAAERRRQALAQGSHHFGDEGQLGADGVGVERRFELAGQFLAERGGGVPGQQLADLAEFQQIQRV